MTMTRTTTDDPWVPLDVPASIPRTSPEVIDWLDPMNRTRYQPRNGATYCNIFAWDWSRALGCEIPHWIDEAGRPAAMGKGRELTINDTITWLKEKGPLNGWFPGAGVGEPCIATWRNPNGHGHVSVVRSEGEDRWSHRYAQAGAVCYADAPLASCFSRPRWQFLLWFHYRKR
jgi:hypothetical protein